MKNRRRENITTIVHDLKTDYAKAFKEKFPSENQEMENVLIEAAKKAKKGYEFQWYLDESRNKNIRFF